VKKKPKTALVEITDNGQFEPGFSFKIDGKELPRINHYKIDRGYDQTHALVTVKFYAVVRAKLRAAPPRLKNVSRPR